MLTAKPDVRLLEDQERRIPLLGEKDVRQVTGGLLVQVGPRPAEAGLRAAKTKMGSRGA